MSKKLYKNIVLLIIISSFVLSLTLTLLHTDNRYSKKKDIIPDSPAKYLTVKKDIIPNSPSNMNLL
ncbi:hypothetical protein EV207_10273 [Scopulibacillus darangshiensis]|uniref:Uncharacterized protein n=1 Tax=Scopulibacillus darangshiensis TaxID=442528 RepID=A0A4R2PBA1_9BACL|nr:hypothetical protein [Scopulibacillus darangshiensis]TCP31584.1 hypothetical protein EV207_10273 [Scopulibacillus darangshiensis]